MPSLLHLLLLLLVVGGCQWSDWDDWHTTYDDYDKDGHNSYAAGGDDCNDDNKAIHPDADEVCDGIDSDCDGLDDDEDALDTKLWSEDLDGDGYGKAAEIRACSQSEGYVAAEGETDCNDSNPAINPGAEEVCDGLDNNCDPAKDSPLPNHPHWKS